MPSTLADVRLLEGSPFKNAMDRDAAYLLTIEPDRLLHRFYSNAGLKPKAEVYGGWESDGLGPYAGHYLSACAMMYVQVPGISGLRNAPIISCLSWLSVSRRGRLVMWCHS